MKSLAPHHVEHGGDEDNPDEDADVQVAKRAVFRQDYRGALQTTRKPGELFGQSGGHGHRQLSRYDADGNQQR